MHREYEFYKYLDSITGPKSGNAVAVWSPGQEKED